MRALVLPDDAAASLVLAVPRERRGSVLGVLVAVGIGIDRVVQVIVGRGVHALQAERGTIDPAKRKAAWKALADHVLTDRPGIYILHRKLLWAYSQKITGFVPYPDGLVRFPGLKLN